MHHYVIDTQVLVIADSPEHPLALDALALLVSLRRHHQLALDDAREIDKEYANNLRPVGYPQIWLRDMRRRGKVVYHKAVLTARQRAALDRVAFDPADRKFVALACRTHHKLLVAEEKHFWSTDCEACLCQRLGLNLLRIADAVTHASS